MADIDLPLLEFDAFPDAMAETPAHQVRTLFPESSLIYLNGRNPQPLFVAILNHGNETVGWEAMKRLQGWMKDHPLPRALMVFVGNVRAAERNMRRLDPQADYNRIWRGGETPQCDLARRVLDIARAARPFAAIDLHNNTGANPHYSLVHNNRPEDAQLASLFSPHVMWTHNPPGTCSEAMSAFCPAITAEVGHSGISANEEAAFQLVLSALHLDHFRGAADQALDLYTVKGRIEISPDVSLGFEHDSPADITLPASLEKWNFFERPAGSIFARTNTPHGFRVRTETGEDVTEDCLLFEDGRVILRRAFTPAMLTINEQAIRDDCLCYLMEKA